MACPDNFDALAQTNLRELVTVRGLCQTKLNSVFDVSCSMLPLSFAFGKKRRTCE